MWTGSSMPSGPASWRWPDDAPRGQAWRVCAATGSIRPTSLNDPPAYQLVRVDGPARSPRAEEPASDDRDPGGADGPARARRPEPRARDIDLG